MLWGQKEEKKERVSLNGRREHFYDRLKKVVEKHLFFLYFEKLFIYRERIRREKKFFHLFFWCASFSRTLLSLLSLSFLSFFSLFSLVRNTEKLPFLGARTIFVPNGCIPTPTVALLVTPTSGTLC